jgi:hypothetical protein
MFGSIRSEILAVGFVLLAGVVLAATTLFSIIQVAEAAQILISQIENGLVYQIILFGAVAAIGGRLMFLIFKSHQKPPEPGIDFKNLAMILANGLIEGFLEPNRQR